MTALPITTYPATREGVSAALAALGDCTDRVADTLADAGHLGAPGESRDCPIAVYLHDVLTPRWPVSIGNATAAVYAGGARLDVPLPGPVRRFVAAFDLDGYPFLRPDDYTDPEATPDPLTRATLAPAGGVW
jgi:hypothetical protein